jgi:WhiB family transcriptional regulator, redox-sensing transcriptional regulator
VPPVMTDWRDRAACCSHDPEKFFPVGQEDSPGYVRQVAKAVEVCTGCTVRVECLDFAMTARGESGIWGGTSDAERRAGRASLTRGAA